MSTSEINEMFGQEAAGSRDTLQVAEELAKQIATDMEKLDTYKECVAVLDESLKERKATLCRMMLESGVDSLKLACGLTPKAKETMKYYKATEVDDSTLHAWLRENDLGDIIVPYVHWSTLNSTLRSHEEQGGSIPDNVIQQSLEYSVTMYGKKKFLEAKRFAEGIGNDSSMM